MLMGLVDLTISAAAAASFFGLSVALWTVSVIVMACFRNKRVPSLAPENEPAEFAVTALFTFAIKGYSIALVLGLAFNSLGGVASACIGAVTLSLFGPVGGPLWPKDVLDVVFLIALLPCLCCPVLLLHGIGAAWLVYLCLAFMWARAAVGYSPVAGSAVLCSLYAFARASGLFLPLRGIRIEDALQLSAMIVVLLHSPRGLSMCVAVAALVSSAPAALFWDLVVQASSR